MKEIKEKYVAYVLIIIFLLVGASAFYVYDKFYSPLDCGENYFVDEVGRRCIFDNHLSIRFEREVSYLEVEEILMDVSGSRITYPSKKSSGDSHEIYFIATSAENQAQQDSIIEQLYNMRPDIKSINTVPIAPIPF